MRADDPRRVSPGLAPFPTGVRGRGDIPHAIDGRIALDAELESWLIAGWTGGEGGTYGSPRQKLQSDHPRGRRGHPQRSWPGRENPAGPCVRESGGGGLAKAGRKEIYS